jgi:RNA polymerase sigma-70 factor (ECF subfamily)
VEQDLAGLSPALRLAFILREVEGLSTAEAARTLGVSPNTLKARLWRARRYLTEGLSRRLRGNGTKPEAGGSLLGPPLCACEGQ